MRSVSFFDSRLDIAVTYMSVQKICIMFVDENATFFRQFLSPINFRSSLFLITTGDSNNDGQVVIAVANSGTDNIGIFLGD